MARHASWHLSVLPLLDALSATGATDLPPDDGAEDGHWRDLPATTREPDDCPQNATLPGAECPLPAPHRAPRVSRPGCLTLPDPRLGGHPTRLPTPTLLVRHTLSSFGALSHEQATSAPSRRLDGLQFDSLVTFSCEEIRTPDPDSSGRAIPGSPSCGDWAGTGWDTRRTACSGRVDSSLRFPSPRSTPYFYNLPTGGR